MSLLFLLMRMESLPEPSELQVGETQCVQGKCLGQPQHRCKTSRLILGCIHTSHRGRVPANGSVRREGMLGREGYAIMNSRGSSRSLAEGGQYVQEES